MVRMFCDVFTKADQRLQNLFTNYHNFSCRCNQRINVMQVCKKITTIGEKCCMALKKALHRTMHFLKDFFRYTTERKDQGLFPLAAALQCTAGTALFAPCAPWPEQKGIYLYSLQGRGAVSNVFVQAV